MPVKENLLEIKRSLPPHVTLVAVSKTKPPALLMEAYEAGQRDLGENYVQELSGKYELLPKDIRWHFIGHLQSNKVKYIAPFVHLIHGVDSLRLLKEIDKQAQKCGRVIDCLLQLHIAQEETKFGFSGEECMAAFKSGAISSLQHVNVRGLMAMASNTEDMEQVKREYLGVKALADQLKAQGANPVIMSYGMSGDYKVAIECGSNMVRVGSSIFGNRAYPAGH